jgi:hypothetical protein
MPKSISTHNIKSNNAANMSNSASINGGSSSNTTLTSKRKFNEKLTNLGILHGRRLIKLYKSNTTLTIKRKSHRAGRIIIQRKENQLFLVLIYINI